MASKLLKDLKFVPSLDYGKISIYTNAEGNIFPWIPMTDADFLGVSQVMTEVDYAFYGEEAKMGEYLTKEEVLIQLATSYTITATSEGGDTIFPGGKTTVPTGRTQLYNIIPLGDKQVKDILVDGVSVGAGTSYEFAGVIADHTIYVEFDPKPHLQTLTQHPQ